MFANCKLRLALMLVVLVTGSAAKASVLYDATAEFSATTNPSGVWSYGWMPTDFSSFNLITGTVIDPASGSTIWSSPVGAHLWVNTDGVTHAGIAPGQMSLHPGVATEAAVLRFTAPTSGIAVVDAEFFAGDTGLMSLGLLLDTDFFGGFVWTATNLGTVTTAPLVVSAGDTIDFVVFGGYASGNTGLAATVDFESTETPASVSAPPAVAAFLTGLLAMSIGRRRKKARNA